MFRSDTSTQMRKERGCGRTESYTRGLRGTGGRIYDGDATPTARKTEDGIYYDAFNAAIQLQAKKDSVAMATMQAPVFYNKSKLVPGVETLPSFLRFMAPIFEQFGGSTGGYGVSDTPVVFRHPLFQQNAAPIICYESVYWRLS